ncbi:MAG: DUF1641 domain-containing protein [Polyangiaceae bacterium]
MTQTSTIAGPKTGAPPTDLAAVLLRIDERLARVERSLESAAAVTAPSTVAIAVDTLDSFAAKAQERGVDLDARLGSALRLVERLTDPKTERALTAVLDLADRAPTMMAAFVDTADSLADRANDMGIDLDDRLRVLARVVERLTAPEALAAVEALLAKVDSLKAVLSSGILDPTALATVATAGDALAKAAAAPPSTMGLFGALRASSDPEVQTALSFLVRFAHAFGADLKDPPNRPKLVAAEIR